jgi:hypothetical protein
MSGDEGRAGVVAEAVKGAVGEIARAGSGGEQLEAFELPTRFVDERAAQQAERTRRPGRPPGATNVATRQMREYLLKRGVNPLEQLMRWAVHTPESLSKELDCTLVEAFREWKALQFGLAEYLFGKAVATDDEGRAVPLFQMFLGGHAAAIGPGARPPWEYGEIVENQALSASEDLPSHGTPSHGVAK